ncbi:MAG: hypothetical protein P4L16_02035 [Chlamydiales bacterium]|nr:hypothetical protein [Chlamydiales bacterium]
MTINCYLSEHFFENRLYISTLSKEKFNSVIFENGAEKKGAGIRCYSTFMGWFLQFFGVASAFNINGKSYYLNHKSICLFLQRNIETQGLDTAQKVAARLNSLYINQKLGGCSSKQLQCIKALFYANYKDCTDFCDLMTQLSKMKISKS